MNGAILPGEDIKLIRAIPNKQTTHLQLPKLTMKLAILPEDSNYCLGDAIYHQDLNKAQEDALNWSIELDGVTVTVYRYTNSEDLNSYKPVTRIWA